MNLSIIGRLPAQNSYCCKEGIVEVGLLDYPTAGTIWCCAKCGHPTEERAKHPVIVEFCKRLVQKVRVVDVTLSPNLGKCSCCKHRPHVFRIHLSNGDYATVCPSCRAVYSHPDDEKLYGVSAEKLASLLGETTDTLDKRLLTITSVFILRRKEEPTPVYLKDVKPTHVEAKYPNGVVKLNMLTFSDESFALVSPNNCEVHEVKVATGEVGMSADRLSELLGMPKEDFPILLPILMRRKGLKI